MESGGWAWRVGVWMGPHAGRAAPGMLQAGAHGTGERRKRVTIPGASQIDLHAISVRDDPGRVSDRSPCHLRAAQLLLLGFGWA
eukprot:scaffold35411_cov101-Isochrysis_galbana.AAC.3